MSISHDVLRPVIRSNWVKLAMSLAKRMPEPKRSQVLAMLEPMRVEVRDAGMLEWKPAELFVSVAEAIGNALGAQSARDFWCDVMVEAFHRRFLKPLVGGALAIYGRKPSSILRMTPQAYSLSFKNCGITRLHEMEQQNSVRLQFDGLPSVLHESDAVLACFAGNCDASLGYLGMAGRVTRHDDDRERGRLHFVVEWHE